jgi:hypothetical protein
MHAQGIDGTILELLADTNGPWKITELEREVGHPIPVQDSVARLVATGLAHRMKGGFVCSSAAGRHVAEMSE